MMNISEYAIRNRRVMWFFLSIMIVGGVYAFIRLGKREDSTFVIKSAVVTCPYPGATPEEVERLVTEPLERSIRTMNSVYKVTSESHFGLARLTVELSPATPADRTPQLWDELRRKVSDVAPRLPEGVGAINVADDFGDVYGMYYALRSDGGFTWSELRDYALDLQTRLYTVDGVQKVMLYGEQTPVVDIYISISTLANFDIRPDDIAATITRQNAIVAIGDKQAGEIGIEIVESGSYSSVDDIADQLLMAADGKQYRLGDVARIERSYRRPAQTLLRVDGRQAIGIAVASDPRLDIVAVGRRVEELLQRETERMPVGVELVTLYAENRIAAQANNTFLLNLLESVAIVVILIMLIMGARSGLLVGSSLLFAIGGTLLAMLLMGEGLNRTSLAGFIIAMGMLVDNAIVVTDNARMLMRKGMGVGEALVAGATSPRWGLLGATLIAVISFFPLYLAPSSVAEIVKPLFVVIAVSLLLSWLLALTQVPMMGVSILKAERRAASAATGGMDRFRRLVRMLIRHRWATVAAVVLLFAASLFAMGRMPQNFFPSLDKPYFRADVLLPEGYNIEATQKRLDEMSDWLVSQSEVVRVSTTAGSTPPRYYLASGSYSGRPNYGNVLVELDSKRHTADVERRFDEHVSATMPDVWLRSSLFKLSPVPDATIEIGFIGENADTLQRLAAEAIDIMRRRDDVRNVRNSWGNRIPVWQPVYSQIKGQRIGVTRSGAAEWLRVATDGYSLGTYREGDQVLPILLKEEGVAAANLTSLQALPVFSRSGNAYSVEQASDGFVFDFRGSVIKRYNGQRVVKAQCDPQRGANAIRLLDELQAEAEAEIDVPDGYAMKIFGEQESRAESNGALAEYMPLTLILMFVILLLLFGNYRAPIIIALMIPLISIGVVAGLAVTGKTFDFFSLLGLLGLVGMNIKNAVILVSRIEELRSEGMAGIDAVATAAADRFVPVVVASGTTVLGLLPLLFDSMFGSMAATIMGGLIVATLLTLGILPVVYSIFYNIHEKR